MKKLVIYILMALSFFNCQSQNSKVKNNTQQQLDTIKPKTKIQVNKEYDKYGNLKRLDSSYSYFYSNITGDTILEREIFNKFNLNLNRQFKPFDSLFTNNFFNGSPFNKPNFYTDDFFKNNYKSHQKRIDKLLQQMDSMKNNFYKNRKSL
ncbi:MAG: hypothetical protein ABJH82_06410 [Polaribacter sp.]|uniref:hypothetical protein n=1 Tax=Polaribacter sp. TaxID=1920175 RepID=UPI0032668BB9